MLPIHAFVADVTCPPDQSAADRFADVGGLFIGWVESAFADELPGFRLPGDGTVEPLPGSVITEQSDRPLDDHERYRLTWRQPWLHPGCELVQEFAVARAGDRLAASVVWKLTAEGGLPVEFAEPVRPAILTRLLPFTTEASVDDRHPLDGLVRRDRGLAFRLVDAALADRRAAEEREKAAFYTEMEAENLALVAERDELRLELEDLHDTVFEQRSQIHLLNGIRRGGPAAAGEVGTVASVAEALDRARAEFPAELLVLKSAEVSAAESPYQYPERVYELLHALGDIARRWRTNALGKEWIDAFREFDPRFEYKPHISKTAATMYRAHYLFQYGGVKRLFESHVSLGKLHDPQKCLSVHWYRDDDARKVVVGWCGRHLPNTRT